MATKSKGKNGIKSYFVDGEARDEVWIVNNRPMLEEYIKDDMRDHGFAPVLDRPMNLSWTYNPERETFSYRIEAFGKFVGKRKAKKVIGVLIEEGIIMSEDHAEPLK